MTRHAGGLFLSQSTYARDIFARVDMVSCKPSTILVYTKHKRSTSYNTPFEDSTIYHSLVNTHVHSIKKLLTYILTLIRVDASYLKHLHTFSHSSVETKYKGVEIVIIESCWLYSLLLEFHFPLP